MTDNGKIIWTNERRKLSGPQRSNLPNVICAQCGKAFHVKPTALHRGRGKYCSLECMRNAGSIVKQCEVCGKEFRFKLSHHVKGQGRYCSMGCRTIGYDQRGFLKGVNAPRYIDGQSQSKEYVCRHSHLRRVQKYENGGSYTLQEWVSLCQKYNYRCLACGRSNVSLTVDHIIPVKLGGTNNIDNLQPLCKSCNSKKNVKVIDYREALS